MRKKPASKSAWRELLESVFWAGGIAIIIRSFIIAPYKIPSGSMRPTLMEGDRIMVSKFLYHFKEPERGDIIVFKFPNDPKRPFIKRLVGLEGEKLEIVDGGILIDDQPVNDGSFISKNDYLNRGTYGRSGAPLQVPEGQYFVLGDNSAASADSRVWGFVPERMVIGRAVCIWWPPKRMQLLR